MNVELTSCDDQIIREHLDGNWSPRSTRCITR